MRNGFRVRVLALCLLAALAFAGIGMLTLQAKTDFPNGKVPPPYFAVSDSGGANNGPGQKDLTQMGWIEDVTTAGGPYIDLFWSWDEDTISGGNSLDGCALFDSNGNTLIETAVCGTVIRTNGQSAGMYLKSVTVYSCADTRNDRCGNPTLKNYAAGDIVGGALKANPLSNMPSPGDELLTNTDPFSAGAGYPYDTTLRVRIRRSFLPANSGLTNVCSYPSTQPNSDPSDCNNPPGSGYLQITKDAHQTEEPYDKFSFKVTSFPSVVGDNNCPSGTPCNATAWQGQTATLSLLVGTASIEEILPSGWSLDQSYCGAASGSATNPLTVTITSGFISQCTFENGRDRGTIKITKIVNDSGKFTLKILSGSTLVAEQTNVGSTQSLAPTTVPTGSYTLTEEGYGGADLNNYTSTYSCDINGSASLAGSGVSINVDVHKGDVIDCTFTNTRIAGSLRIIKNLNNAADPDNKTISDFKYKINSGDWIAFPSDGVVLIPVDPNGSYTVTEQTTAGYLAQYSGDCTNVVVASGETKTCTIQNTAQKASPTGTTTMKWELHDSITIVGIKGAAGTATVDFRLYSDAGCSTQVGFELNRPVVGGVASTSTGIVVNSQGSYRWRATYSGDAYNNGFTTACGSEVSQITATYNQ